MPAQKAKKRPFTKLRCENCAQVNYFTKKSRELSLSDKKMEAKKFCAQCRTHTTHKETRK